MNSIPTTGADALNALAEEFVERWRRGERPSPDEYAARCPELADRIRELFPALVIMEELGSVGGAEAAPPPPGGAPERLGEYRLVREIGRGGMGVVYEAVQESLGRRVALKVLPPAAVGLGQFLERFHREARAAARLHHTNIVPVFGVGEDRGAHFYAMQFIQGHGLDIVLREVKRLREGKDETPPAGDGLSVTQPLLDGQFLAPFAAPPPGGAAEPATGSGPSALSGAPEAVYWRSVARLGLQAAEALAYAHGQGLLHRDIKPSNLLLDAQGTLWITDFGLAKDSGAENLTAVGDLVGTLRYMAPECFRGQTDACSDVYALGVTLYEMLTLRPAFVAADRLQLIRAIAHDAPPRPRELAPHMPADLETVVLKAMAREPADRYATAAALAEDLRRFLEDRPVRARRSSVLERLRRWRRRNPAVARLTFAVAALLLALTAGSALAAVWLGWAWDNAVKAKGAAEKSDAEKTDKLWQSLYERARAGRFGQRPGRRLDTLDTLAEAQAIRSDERLRTETIAALALTDLRPAREWPGWPPGAFNMDFDDSLERYARSDRQGNVSVRRAADDREIVRFSTGFLHGPCVEFAPGGRFLALQDSRTWDTQVWDLADERPTRRLSVACGDYGNYAFSPDGTRVAVATPNAPIAVYELPSGRMIRSGLGEPGDRKLAFHPDGRLLAAAGGSSSVVLDSETGETLWRLPAATEMSGPRWSPAGDLLATVGDDRRIYLWDVPGRRLHTALEGCRNGGIGVAFNHAGDLLVSRGLEGLLRVWDPRTGRQLISTPAGFDALRFSPDDRRLAGERDGDRVRIWEFAAGGEYRSLTHDGVAGRPVYYKAAFHPRGRLLALSMSDGVRLWDLAAGRQCAYLPGPECRSVAFEEDGALLTRGTGAEPKVTRWPVQPDPADPHSLRVGPPQETALPCTRERLACSRDGQVIANAWYDDGAGVLAGGRLLRLQPHRDVRAVAVSPDGRWVATGSRGGDGVKVWQLGDDRPVLEVPSDDPAWGVFSPDGRWLATSSWQECRVWSVGSWTEVRRFVGQLHAFSPDGALASVSTKDGAVGLVDVETGREYARLEDPNQDRGPAYFSPDGATVVTVCDATASIHVWDLRAIRRELAARGLDWGLPPYPPAPPPGKPLRVTVVGPEGAAGKAP